VPANHLRPRVPTTSVGQLEASESLRQRVAQRRSVVGPFDQILELASTEYMACTKFSLAIGCAKALYVAQPVLGDSKQTAVSYWKNDV
jgi:hypothetical protein